MLPRSRVVECYLKEAVYWFRLAEEQREEHAKRNLELCRKELEQNDVE